MQFHQTLPRFTVHEILAMNATRKNKERQSLPIFIKDQHSGLESFNVSQSKFNHRTRPKQIRSEHRQNLQRQSQPGKQKHPYCHKGVLEKNLNRRAKQSYKFRIFYENQQNRQDKITSKEQTKFEFLHKNNKCDPLCGLFKVKCCNCTNSLDCINEKFIKIIKQRGQWFKYFKNKDNIKEQIMKKSILNKILQSFSKFHEEFEKKFLSFNSEEHSNQQQSNRISVENKESQNRNGENRKILNNQFELNSGISQETKQKLINMSQFKRSKYMKKSLNNQIEKMDEKLNRQLRQYLKTEMKDEIKKAGTSKFLSLIDWSYHMRSLMKQEIHRKILSQISEQSKKAEGIKRSRSKFSKDQQKNIKNKRLSQKAKESLLMQSAIGNQIGSDSRQKEAINRIKKGKMRNKQLFKKLKSENLIIRKQKPDVNHDNKENKENKENKGNNSSHQLQSIFASNKSSGSILDRKKQKNIYFRISESEDHENQNINFEWKGTGTKSQIKTQFTIKTQFQDFEKYQWHERQEKRKDSALNKRKKITTQNQRDSSEVKSDKNEEKDENDENDGHEQQNQRNITRKRRNGILKRRFGEENQLNLFRKEIQQNTKVKKKVQNIFSKHNLFNAAIKNEEQAFTKNRKVKFFEKFNRDNDDMTNFCRTLKKYQYLFKKNESSDFENDEKMSLQKQNQRIIKENQKDQSIFEFLNNNKREINRNIEPLFYELNSQNEPVDIDEEDSMAQINMTFERVLIPESYGFVKKEKIVEEKKKEWKKLSEEKRKRKDEAKWGLLQKNI